MSTTTTTTTPRRRSSAALTAQKVETYLRENPEFFVEHTDLLEVIKIPHITGQAISLIERQVSVLREKNSALQTQLAELIQIARENNALTQRLHELTIALLVAANDPASILEVLETGLYRHFQVDRVALRCFSNCNDPALSVLSLDPEDVRLHPYLGCLSIGEPWCDWTKDAGNLDFLFGDDTAILSFALVPFSHPGFQGLLALGSYDADRFRPGIGSVFLRIMGEIVAARLAALWALRHGDQPCENYSEMIG